MVQLFLHTVIDNIIDNYYHYHCGGKKNEKNQKNILFLFDVDIHY
jgi:hypothetical protein